LNDLRTAYNVLCRIVIPATMNDYGHVRKNFLARDEKTLVSSVKE
jgi:hypothetical protein